VQFELTLSLAISAPFRGTFESVRGSADARAATRTALVTGAAGFVGCHLAERLSRAGWFVRGIDDERTGDWRRLESPVEQIDGSLEDMSRDDLRAACRDVDVLFHLAAEKHNTPGVTADRMVEVNVAATQRLFAAAGAERTRKIVFTSSLYAYGSLGPEAMSEIDLPAPTTVYGLSKLAGEHLLRVAERNHGVSWSVARLFFVYGPRQLAAGGYPSVIIRNFERIARGQPPVVNGDGAQALDYVYVDDCVAGLVALAAEEHDGVTVNLAGGAAVSVEELTRLMLSVSGSALEPISGPADWTAGTRRWGDTALALHVLGWKASTPLDLGLQNVWESLA
jgi:UDP-glucose 4-epimerase